MTNSLITEFVEAIQQGTMARADVFADGATLDATVPNWRFEVRGATAINAELGRWYADPGEYLELIRTEIADGELVQLSLTWTEEGVAHRCHQAHVLKVADGRIVSDTAYCGGRWPASLVAEMAAAQAASDEAGETA
jgi:hypothetical protein